MMLPGSSLIARELDDFWKDTQSLISPLWVEMDHDIKMATGQQQIYDNIYGAGGSRGQKMLIFNKILRILNMVEGYQRDHRLATMLIPSDNDIDVGETTDQLNTVLNYCMTKDHTYEKISDCFSGSNTCGLNLLSVWMDFREDPQSGKICTERLPFSAFVMDPYWTKPDLSDCNRIWTRKYITQQQLLDIFPDVDTALVSVGSQYSARDGKFQFLPQNWQQYQMPLYAYDEYWKKEYKTERKLLDKTTGEVASWYGNREQFQLLRNINPNVTLIKARVPTIRLHVLINNTEMYSEQSPWGLNRMPFVPFTCYHYPEVQNYAFRHQGLVRAVRDSQTYVNRTRNNLFDMMQAQVQSGLMLKEDALVNPEDAFMQGPGRALFFKNTANLATDVVQIPPPAIGAGWMELIDVIEKEITDIVGPEELFANNLGGQEMSGVFLKLKMGAGLTGLRNIFDRLNQSQQILGEITTDLILNNFTVGKITSIIGKQPSQVIQEATTPEIQMKGIATQFMNYNCTVEEGELTATQRQLQFVQAMQLKQAGIPISNKYILEKSTIQGKKEVIENIMQQEQQAAQLQQIQMQQEINQTEVMTRSIEAKSQNDFARAIEGRTRAVSNLGLAKEREAMAEHDLAKTALDNAKAIKELEEMDENRLVKLAQHIVQIQQMQRDAAFDDQLNSVEESSLLGEPVDHVNELTMTTEQQQKEQGPGNQQLTQEPQGQNEIFQQ